ncbi:type II secretion system F family protein [Cellulomonas sp. P4]|uniref:type II secretion system F family protein n=1 Tax=Cellulomonas sp. P4 TaxID=3142533 RepID=UPI0031BAFE38
MTEVLLVALVAAAWLLARPGARRVSPPRTSDPAVVEVEVDLATAVDLVAVAVEAGASVPHALRSVGAAIGGRRGDDLARAGAAVLLGASWPTAWAHAPVLGATLDGLGAAWAGGTAPGPALRTAADELRRRRARAARDAAGRLGVRLVLPLGLCFLPAFVLLGLVPVLASFLSRLLG